MTRRITTVAVLVLALCAPAYATSVLFTQPAPVADLENFICTFANVGTKAIPSVVIDVFHHDGTKSGTTFSNIGPGETEALVESGPADFLYCRFTVSASKHSVRAGFCVGNPCQATGAAY